MTALRPAQRVSKISTELPGFPLISITVSSEGHVECSARLALPSYFALPEWEGPYTMPFPFYSFFPFYHLSN